MPREKHQSALASSGYQSFDQMHNDLQDAIKRLTDAISDTSFEVLTPTLMQSAWMDRIEQVNYIPSEIMDNPDALVHWKSLTAVAWENYRLAKDEFERIQEHRAGLIQQEKTLQDAIKRLAEAQQKSSFHESMKAVTSSVNKPHYNPYSTDEKDHSREVALLIHTADALIEIKKDDN